jgi:hypothetical protein
MDTVSRPAGRCNLVAEANHGKVCSEQKTRLVYSLLSSQSVYQCIMVTHVMGVTLVSYVTLVTNINVMCY